jgi:hypothetical protein
VSYVSDYYFGSDGAVPTFCASCVGI